VGQVGFERKSWPTLGLYCGIFWEETLTIGDTVISVRGLFFPYKKWAASIRKKLFLTLGIYEKLTDVQPIKKVPPFGI
jgi:hypothetical protein